MIKGCSSNSKNYLLNRNLAEEALLQHRRVHYVPMFYLFECV